MKSGPMTLGNLAAEPVRLTVVCLHCRHQIEANAAELADRCGNRAAGRDHVFRALTKTREYP